MTIRDISTLTDELLRSVGGNGYTVKEAKLIKEIPSGSAKKSNARTSKLAMEMRQGAKALRDVSSKTAEINYEDILSYVELYN